MSNEALRKVQLSMLDIAVEIKRVCEEMISNILLIQTHFCTLQGIMVYAMG